jgi:hypothetical protein
MKGDKTKLLKKSFRYLALLEQADPPRNAQIDDPLSHGRTLSPEELEEQERRYRRFLLLQTLRS